MKGNEVIENADVRDPEQSHRSHWSRAGQVQVPNDAHVIDVTGKTITPGFVDTHAHLRVPQPIHRGEVWSLRSEPRVMA